MEKTRQFTTEYHGTKINVEIGKFVPHANGSCTVRYGDTMVLATVIMGEEAVADTDYFPLKVEVRERYYAAGKIKGSRYNKREGKPSELSILCARMIDRGIRPLFPQSIANPIHVCLTILSIDRKNSHLIAGILATSIALHISDIPWQGPLVGVSMGQLDGNFLINPPPHQQKESEFNLTFSCSRDKILMIDADARETSRDVLLKALEFGMVQSQSLLQFIDDIRKQAGKPKWSPLELAAQDASPDDVPLEAKEQALENAKAFFEPLLEKYLFNQPAGAKRERKKTAVEMLVQLTAKLRNDGEPDEIIRHIEKNFSAYLEAEVSRAILEREQRIDRRRLNELRPLSCEIALIPRAHGSAFFQRGETHILSVITLGGPEDEMSVESMDNEERKHVMHHYNSPPYAFGEATPGGTPGRREIGHGFLAEKALQPVLPDRVAFPYTIRMVSEVMSSNGSSSMASVCASSLALMDAGVPIKRPVAGIAIGMASDGETYKIITDLQDLEDGTGGMDFKIAATEKGITAIQMDTKTDGLSLEVCEKTMSQAEDAITEILLAMMQTISEPRADVSKYAPRINTIKIDPAKIRDVIGPGGKIINEIKESTETSIIIDQDGTVTITAGTAKNARAALSRIAELVQEPEVGEVYDARITRILDFGALAEFLPGREGLIHISEMQNKRITNILDVVNIGDTVKVKLLEIDKQGRFSLSMKAVGLVP
ncbi:polyribonucleotide nucleotidyltransferase [candidate division KSB1 bacterium]|nr:polyribonucleotide nucleotidyltransferase [candidate division KSB1 bacterium]